MKRLVYVVISLSAAIGCSNSTTAPGEGQASPTEDVSVSDSSLEIFEQRILPIFRSKNPSSCTECHLAGVELRDYIRPSQQATYSGLVEAGLIDTANPEASKILEFINRRSEKSDLITARIREQELQAFRAWIVAATRSPELNSTTSADAVGPTVPIEIIRHSRKDRVLASFIDNIWTEIGRCAACHSPDRNQKQVKENGVQVSWIKINDPETTMKYMIANGLVDAKNPTESLLLKKPTMQVEHGGGQKMVVGDRTYKQFRRFIDDYIATTNNQYESAAQLPHPGHEVSTVSEIWLKVEGVPEMYDKMLMQVDLYKMQSQGWSKQRVATSDRPVFGKGKLWQHSLSLTARRDSTAAQGIESKQLAAGRYLAKIYIDRSGKLAKDFRTELNEEDFVGQVEVQSKWPSGYGRMTVIAFPTE